MIRFIKISGHSMEPTLKAGSIHLAEKFTFLFRNPRPGDIIVFINPGNPAEWLCKRIKSFDPQTGAFEAVGDNFRDSLDSETLGVIKKSQIVGRLIL